jgi:predicted lipoprotein
VAVACAVVVCALAAVRPSIAQPAPIVAPSAWMQALVRQVLAPRAAAAASVSEALAQRIGAVCQGGDPDAAREAWRAAALALRGLSPLPFGPLLELRTLRRVDFWPTRPPQIERSIRGRADGSLPEARIGVTARGLPALEYLLFDAGAPDLRQDAAACRYAHWVAEDTAGQLAALRPAFDDWQSRLAEADAQAEAALLTDGVNILIGGIDTLRLRYLEKPARSSAAQPDFDAWRSGATRAHLLAYHGALRLGLQGRVTTTGETRSGAVGLASGQGPPGLTAVLRGRGLLTLADRVDVLLDRSEAALRELPVSIGSVPADAAVVDPAIERLGELQVLLARDIADRLKVSVGFGDNDGD